MCRMICQIDNIDTDQAVDAVNHSASVHIGIFILKSIRRNILNANGGIKKFCGHGDKQEILRGHGSRDKI